MDNDNAKRTRVRDALDRLVYAEDERVVGAWNAFAARDGGHDAVAIHVMSDFNVVFAASDPMEVAEAVYGDDFIPIERWFSVDPDGSAYSYDELCRGPVDTGAMAARAVARDDDLGLPEVRAILAG